MPLVILWPTQYYAITVKTSLAYHRWLKLWHCIFVLSGEAFKVKGNKHTHTHTHTHTSQVILLLVQYYGITVKTSLLYVIRFARSGTICAILKTWKLWRRATFSKPWNVPKSNTPPWEFFAFFKLYKW